MIWRNRKMEIKDDNDDKFTNVKKFIREVKDFANKYVAYETIEDIQGI